MRFFKAVTLSFQCLNLLSIKQPIPSPPSIPIPLLLLFQLLHLPSIIITLLFLPIPPFPVPAFSHNRLELMLHPVHKLPSLFLPLKSPPFHLLELFFVIVFDVLLLRFVAVCEVADLLLFWVGMEIVLLVGFEWGGFEDVAGL